MLSGVEVPVLLQERMLSAVEASAKALSGVEVPVLLQVASFRFQAPSGSPGTIGPRGPIQFC
jgi:hypothetical protein